jgi:hypothetical protein
MRQEYQSFNFRGETLLLIDSANRIIEEYQGQGFRLTVRQLYYQFVARDLVQNTMKSYIRIATALNDGRLAGLVDWDAIEDRTREFIRRPRWTSAKDILEGCAAQFHVDMWEGQSARAFVVVEKEALAGVLDPVCHKWDVPLLAARGYPSVSVVREFAELGVLPAMRAGQSVLILHLGDHDPSGIDMTRDLRGRLELFCGDPREVRGRHGSEISLEVRRIALNMDQVEEHGPPPNPAKATDSRFQDYRAKHGDESWELDALEPRVLAALVEEHVSEIVEPEPWRARQAEIGKARRYIAAVAKEAP